MKEKENIERWIRNREHFMVRDALRIKEYLKKGEIEKAKKSEDFFNRNLLEKRKLEKELKKWH